MRIELGFSEDVAIVRLSGKFLAGSDGPFLRQKVNDLIEAGSRKLILDFAEVPYIDSTGLGFLAGSHKTAQGAGVSVILASLNEHVRKVLDSVQLSQFFVIAESEAEALAKFKEAVQPADDTRPAAARPAKTRKRPPATNA
ncbi:MAG: STAS domain-containing protein [Acidobacteriia bacterium]|nr:STAS domain-containing protein [Terriglobia bacterium]